MVIKNKNSNNDCHHGVPYSSCTRPDFSTSPHRPQPPGQTRTQPGKGERLLSAPRRGAGLAPRGSAHARTDRPRPPIRRLRVPRAGRGCWLLVARAHLLGLWLQLAGRLGIDHGFKTQAFCLVSLPSYSSPLEQVLSKWRVDSILWFSSE